MFLAVGWAVIQSSRAAYSSAALEQLDALDEEILAADQALHDKLRDWFELNGSGWIKWQFSEIINNHRDILQFHTSRNHRPASVWSLMEFIAEQSPGSYGVVFVHDDEDNGARMSNDFSQSFRVWRILDGQITEHADPLFSPFSSTNAFEI
jgi:hypothetical protein